MFERGDCGEEVRKLGGKWRATKMFKQAFVGSDEWHVFLYLKQLTLVPFKFMIGCGIVSFAL